MTDDELRRLLREGDAPARVHAAFELARRLGHGADLPIDQEPSSGVRRHWLTVLASFGERDAVRAIAEARAGDEEGEHAIHLALQLGIGDEAWWADRFAAATERAQAALLARAWERLAWASVVPTLEHLLESDVVETRRLAAERLLPLPGQPGPALRRYALAHPADAAAVLDAWAAGPDHRALFDALPWGLHPGVRALSDAGRTYPLGAHVPHPDLLQRPHERRVLLQQLDALLERGIQFPRTWFEALVDDLGPPWDAAEARIIDAWWRDADDAELGHWVLRLLGPGV